MSLGIDIGHAAGHSILSLSGRLNGSTAAQLESWLAEQAAVPSVWDLSQLDFVSSAGLRVLIAHEKQVRRAGQSTTLVGVSPAVHEVLRMTGLAALWTLLPSLEALEATPGPAIRATPAADETMTASTGARVAVQRQAAGPATLLHWNDGAWRGASLRRLGLSFGRGGLGTHRDVAMARPLRFAGLISSLNICLDDGECDVLAIAEPDHTFVRVDEAWSFGGAPTARLRVDSDLTTAALGEVARTVSATPWCAMLMLVPGGAEGSHESAQSARLVFGVLPPGDDASWIGCHIAIDLVTPDVFTAPSVATWLEVLPRLAGEDLADGLPSELPTGSVAFLWGAASAAAAADHTLRIESGPGEAGDGDETELIVRSLYADCSRVVLTRLTGGYSASTSQVESFDALGRRMLPTVLKVGPASMMRRENEAHERYVRPFILNNASVGLGMATQGELVGLRYNFLGVTGDQGALRTLARGWSVEPAPRMHDLYEQVVRRTLSPWYGQAREVEAALYVDHTPLRLFPGLIAAARATLPHDLDAPTLRCEALERTVPNPWWFLIHEFPRRQAQRIRCRVSITHGDLNLNNILCDERDNLYVIDFSETRERSVGSDFARLESVFLLLQRPAPAPGTATAQFLRAVEALYAADTPWYALPAGASVLPADDLAFIGRLRRLAQEHLGASAPAEAYLLPVLEWTLPMAAWPNLPLALRELSTWVAALQVERLETSRG